MEKTPIIIHPDPMTQKISTTSILTLGVAFLCCWLVFGDMPVAGIIVSFLLLGLLLLLILEFLMNIRTIILLEGECIFNIGKYQQRYCCNDLTVVVYNYCRPSTTGDALDGSGVIISAKPIPSSIHTDARSYCLLHAPLTSVFIRFSQVDDDQRITYRKGGFSSKGHTANKEEIIKWLLENNILFHQC